MFWEVNGQPTQEDRAFATPAAGAVWSVVRCVCVCVLFFEVASGIWVRAKVFLTRAAVVGVVHWLLVVGVRLVAEDTRPEYRDSKWCFRSRS